MKKILLSLVLLCAVSASAQDATLTVPVSKTITKYVTSSFSMDVAQASIVVDQKDAGGNTLSTVSFLVPDSAHPTATLANFVTAFTTARGGETGGVLRRLNFRILGYLFDQGYLPAATLNP